jgi:Tfp pilus assembly protein FimT
VQDKSGQKNFRGREAGLTLVEAVVVLAIVGVLAVVATLNINRAIAHWELVTAARTMVSDMRSARDLAMTKGMDTVVWIYKDQGHYAVERRDGVWESVYLPKRVQFADGFIDSEGKYKICPSDFSFTSSGTSSTGTSKLESTSEEARYVIVFGNTGRVRVSPDPP